MSLLPLLPILPGVVLEKIVALVCFYATSQTYRQNLMSYISEKAPTEEVASTWLGALIMAGSVTFQEGEVHEGLGHDNQPGWRPSDRRVSIKVPSGPGGRDVLSCWWPLFAASGLAGWALKDQIILPWHGGASPGFTNSLHYYARETRLSDKMLMMLMIGQHLLMYCHVPGVIWKILRSGPITKTTNHPKKTPWYTESISPTAGFYRYLSRWWFQICFIFTPNLGKMIPFWMSIFFRWGWWKTTN